MAQAFVLINCNPGAKNQVDEKLEKITGIKESQQVFGAYDCIVKTKDISSKDLQNIVREQIRTIDGVRSTLTLRKEIS